MPTPDPFAVSAAERTVLRELARRQLDYAHSRENAERREAWYALDAGRAHRPMILCEWGLAFEATLDPASLVCRGEFARGLEKGFRAMIYQQEAVRDDHVVEPWLNAAWKATASNYGVEAVKEYADNAGQLGARRWEHPIRDLRRDFGKLRPRTFSVDRAASLAHRAALEELFDGILPVRMRGAYWWTLGMTIVAVDLIGLENLMLYMYDDPEGLHRLMAFLRDDHLRYAAWLEAEGLLTLNNENDYIGSGSCGYTRRLPAPDAAAGAPVRTRDLWALLESQETVGVGPDLFEEFVFPCQRDIAERFGAVYYGCCEPVHSRWRVLETLPNLRRVSVSPWCDQAFMAEALGTRYVFSRKPNPTLISTNRFDEAAIREDLRATLTAARACNLEIVMKDVHTLAGHPERMARWVALAREEAARLAR